MATNEYDISIEQMAAGLAHEVKNPLSLVKANIDLLELNDTEKQNEKNYKIIRREVDRINDLLLDFIQYTKPIDMELTEISIYDLLCDIIDTLRTSYDKCIEFELIYGNGTGCVFADESKLRRVFMNLLKNALESVSDARSNDGKITIKIRQTRGYTTVKIRDNGVGIDSSEIKNISTPFYTTKSGGSGLGLFISKAIINEHKGRLDITGEKGKGCTVTVRLPRTLHSLG